MSEENRSESQGECALTVEDARLLLHELRAPMTAIVGYAGMLRHSDSPEDRVAIIDGLERAVVRMDAMLEAASLGNLKPRPLLGETEQVDICTLVDDAAADARVSSAVEISSACTPCEPLTADPLLLRRAIDNLLANAVRYGRGSTIEVSVGREESIVAIEVSDRGPGIPEADRERVMQPLERLDRDEDSSGTGLGLSIVADIARAHGGTARILEREEGGTTVRVELPAGS